MLEYVGELKMVNFAMEEVMTAEMVQSDEGDAKTMQTGPDVLVEIFEEDAVHCLSLEMRILRCRRRYMVHVHGHVYVHDDSAICAVFLDQKFHRYRASFDVTLWWANASLGTGQDYCMAITSHDLQWDKVCIMSLEDFHYSRSVQLRKN
jgi:hypothetical protein